jgi:hypothetical protein
LRVAVTGEGRAFHLYLPTIVSKLSKSFFEYSRIRAEQRAAGGRGEDAEEQDVKAAMTLWDPPDTDTATTAIWKPFKSWIMLMLVQFDAADALCTFVDLVPNLSSANIEVKIVYSPVISDETIPLEDLLTKYIPEAASDNSPTNAKLLDFINAARVVQSQAKRISSFKESLSSPNRRPAAIAFLTEVMEEVKEDSEDSDDEAKRKREIFDLSRHISKLLSSQPAQEAGAQI